MVWCSCSVFCGGGGGRGLLMLLLLPPLLLLLLLDARLLLPPPPPPPPPQVYCCRSLSPRAKHTRNAAKGQGQPREGAADGAAMLLRACDFPLKQFTTLQQV